MTKSQPKQADRIGSGSDGKVAARIGSDRIGSDFPIRNSPKPDSVVGRGGPDQAADCMCSERIAGNGEERVGRDRATASERWRGCVTELQLTRFLSYCAAASFVFYLRRLRVLGEDDDYSGRIN